MIGYIITGHGHFASGILSALELIIGKQEDLMTVDFPETDTKTEIENNLKQAISTLSHCDSIVVFCDLLSGTPFNTAIMEAMNNDKIQVVYGTNLGMLMEMVMMRMQKASQEEIVNKAIETGKNGIGKFEVVQDDDDTDW